MSDSDGLESGTQPSTPLSVKPCMASPERTCPPAYNGSRASVTCADINSKKVLLRMTPVVYVRIRRSKKPRNICRFTALSSNGLARTSFSRWTALGFLAAQTNSAFRPKDEMCGAARRSQRILNAFNQSYISVHCFVFTCSIIASPSTCCCCRSLIVVPWDGLTQSRPMPEPKRARSAGPA